MTSCTSSSGCRPCCAADRTSLASTSGGKCTSMARSPALEDTLHQILERACPPRASAPARSPATSTGPIKQAGPTPFGHRTWSDSKGAWSSTAMAAAASSGETCSRIPRESGQSTLAILRSAKKHSIPFASRQPCAKSASVVSPNCRIVTNSGASFAVTPEFLHGQHEGSRYPERR
jgi:hypothetical protein